jgi:hypothetical protein
MATSNSIPQKHSFLKAHSAKTPFVNYPQSSLSSCAKKVDKIIDQFEEYIQASAFSSNKRILAPVSFTLHPSQTQLAQKRVAVDARNSHSNRIPNTAARTTSRSRVTPIAPPAQLVSISSKLKLSHSSVNKPSVAKAQLQTLSQVKPFSQSSEQTKLCQSQSTDPVNIELRVIVSPVPL